MTKKIVFAVLTLLMLGLLVVALRGCAEPALSPQDVKTIARCQTEGRACKSDGGRECYAVYDACMLDGGMR